MILICTGMTVTAALTLLRAFTCMWAADACGTAFFLFSYVDDRRTYDHQKDCYNKNICQTDSPIL